MRAERMTMSREILISGADLLLTNHFYREFNVFRGKGRRLLYLTAPRQKIGRRSIPSNSHLAVDFFVVLRAIVITLNP
jgi:hypothetical protein